jgi:asparagine synthase (glutamine-hydrolysing)
MSLSGGLDSRAILSALSVAGRPVVTFTLGVRGCADERIAATLSRLAGTRHRFVELDERYLGDFLPNLERMVQLTDGMYLSHGLTEMLALRVLEQLGVEVLLRGHCGELAKTRLAWPFHTDARVQACGTRDEFVSYMADRANYVSRGVPAADLFAKDGPALARAAIESLHDTIDHADLSPAQLCSYIYIEAHQRRFTVPSLELFRTRARIVLPFADTAFLDVLLRGPAEWREGTGIHKFIIGQNDHRLLSVRNSNTGAPGDAGPLLEAVLDKVNSVLKRMNAPGYRHYHRLDRWMRTPLLASVEKVLLDPLTLGRGVFRPETVRRLVAETRAGRADHSHLLEVLLHIELWQRQHVPAPQTTHPCVALG